MEEFIAIVQNVGFPVFVSLFLLVRIETTLKKLSVLMAKMVMLMERRQE